MKTAIIIGRFQPITTMHLFIILEALEKYENVITVVVNSKKSIEARNSKKITKKLELELRKNPFTGKLRRDMIYESSMGRLERKNIITNTTADFNEIVKKIKNIYNTSDFVVLCGSDREETYRRQIDNYFDKSLGNIDIDIIERNIESADNVSATSVREALVENYKDTFEFYTPCGIKKYYNRLRGILCNTLKT